MIILKEIIFRCKDNDVVKDIKMEAYELDFYIYLHLFNLTVQLNLEYMVTGHLYQVTAFLES